MRPTKTLGIAVLCVAMGTSLSVTGLEVDLRQIGHIAPKGRVQDKEYNKHLPLVDELINAGPAAIPFLLSKLEDETEIKGHVFDYWPYVCVGDVALVILVNFLTTSDWLGSTVPGLDWNTLLERSGPDEPGWVVLRDFVAKHGRKGLRHKVEEVLRPYRGRFTWDSKELCFKPKE
jgi:hypothetical protein